jgi:hypothetical protein
MVIVAAAAAAAAANMACCCLFIVLDIIGWITQKNIREYPWIQMRKRQSTDACVTYLVRQNITKHHTPIIFVVTIFIIMVRRQRLELVFLLVVVFNNNSSSNNNNNSMMCLSPVMAFSQHVPKIQQQHITTDMTTTATTTTTSAIATTSATATGTATLIARHGTRNASSALSRSSSLFSLPPPPPPSSSSSSSLLPAVVDRRKGLLDVCLVVFAVLNSSGSSRSSTAAAAVAVLDPVPDNGETISINSINSSSSSNNNNIFISSESAPTTNSIIISRTEKDFSYEFIVPSSTTNNNINNININNDNANNSNNNNTNFIIKKKPLKTHVEEMNIVSTLYRGYQYGITVDPIRISSLQQFGTPTEIATKVVMAEMNRDGVQGVTLMKDPMVLCDNHNGLLLNYQSTGTRGIQRYIVKLIVSTDQKLYVLTGQCRDSDYDTLANEIDQAMNNFHVLSMSSMC